MKKFLVRNGKGRAILIFNVKEEDVINVLHRTNYDPKKMSFAQVSSIIVYLCIIKYGNISEQYKQRVKSITKKEWVYLETV